jgi:hypothetical protein
VSVWRIKPQLSKPGHLFCGINENTEEAAGSGLVHPACYLMGRLYHFLIDELPGANPLASAE